jgi:putative membrane protein
MSTDQQTRAAPLDAPRVDLPPQRLHPAWIVISAVRQFRAFIVPLAVAILLQQGRSQVVFLGIGSVLAAAGIITQTLTWMNFRYEVAGGELRVRSGLISRRERSVPLERIQAVDTSENLLQRLFKVVQVTVETAAGGADTDVKLEALRREDAIDLIGRLDAARLRRGEPVIPVDQDAESALDSAEISRPAAQVAPAIAGQSELIRRITTRDLMLAGATSGRIGPAIAIMAAGWQFADDILGDDVWERLALQAAHTTIQGLVLIAAIVAVCAWLLAFASTVLTFGGFEVRRQDDRLIVRHGVLDRRQSTIPIARIQAISIGEPLLRQPLGLAAVRFESAGYGKDTAESGVLFPVLPRGDVRELIARCAPAFAIDDRLVAGHGLYRLPLRARARYIMAEVYGLLAFVLAGVVVAALVPRVAWWWGLVPLVLTPLVALYGFLQYRDAGWTIDAEDRLLVRGRTLNRWLTITPRRRVQRRLVRQNLFQRRVDLANFTYTVASGGQGGVVSIRHLDAKDADELASRLGPRRRSPERA